MNYNELCTAVKNELLTNEKWKIEEKDIKFYAQGHIPVNEHEKKIINETNLKYMEKEAEIALVDFFIIESGDSICRFSLDYLFEEYRIGGWERVKKIIDENIAFSNKINSFDIVEFLKDYELVKDRLIIRPLNYQKHRHALKDCVYKVEGNIALVMYVIAYEDEDALDTFLVQKIMLELWNKNEEEIWNEALINTNIKYPPRLYFEPCDSINPPYEKGAFMALNSEIKQIKTMQAPVITTAVKQINGAMAMFYPGVQEKISELCGGSYYVAFCGIDHARIHAANSYWKPLNILRGIKDTNKAFPDTMLSNKVFYYDTKKKTFTALEL